MPPLRTVLARCIAEWLVGGEGFAVDGSLIKADAKEGTGGLPPENVSPAARGYLAVLDDAAPLLAIFGGVD